MSTPDIVGQMIDALNASSAPYMVTCSLSSNVHGIARSTKDADFVIEASNQQMDSIVQAVAPVFELDPEMSFETIPMTHKTVLKNRDSDFSIELFDLSNDAHDQLWFSRRRHARVLDKDSWLPTPEDVIIQKLRWSKSGRRRKDVDGVTNVISVHREHLDWPYLESWCRRHGTLDLLNNLRAKAV